MKRPTDRPTDAGPVHRELPLSTLITSVGGKGGSLPPFLTPSAGRFNLTDKDMDKDNGEGLKRAVRRRAKALVKSGRSSAFTCGERACVYPRCMCGVS